MNCDTGDGDPVGQHRLNDQVNEESEPLMDTSQCNKAAPIDAADSPAVKETPSPETAAGFVDRSFKRGRKGSTRPRRTSTGERPAAGLLASSPERREEGALCCQQLPNR